MEDRVHLEARVQVEVAVPVGMVPTEAMGVVPAVAGDVVPAVARDVVPAVAGDVVPAVAVDVVQVEAGDVVRVEAGDVVPAMAGDEAPVEVVVMVVVGLFEDSFQAHFLGKKLTFPLINPQHHSLFHLPLALMSL